MHAEDDLDDARLLAQTRAGNRDAFGVLWRRHAQVAGGVARSFTSSVDPDDLVAESFARVYMAIRNGGGPNESFRPYLLTTLRNTARTWGRKSHESATDSIEDYIEASDPDPILLGLANRELIQRTFSSLPTRWQEALWWSEVEGRSTAEIAELTGLSDNAASALCYRAREGLRQAWIQTQLPVDAADPDCRWTLTRMAAHVRSGLRSNQESRVQEHLDSCRRCAGVAVRAARIGSTLGIALVGVSSGGVALAAVLATGAGGAIAPTGFAKLKSLTTKNPALGVAVAVASLVLAVPAVAASGLLSAGPTEAAQQGGAVAALTRPSAAATAAVDVTVPDPPKTETKTKTVDDRDDEVVAPTPAPTPTQTTPATPVRTEPTTVAKAKPKPEPATTRPTATQPSTTPAPVAPAVVQPEPKPVVPSDPEPAPPVLPVEPVEPAVVPETPLVTPTPSPEPEPSGEPSATTSPTPTPPPSTPAPDPGDDGDGDGDGDCDRLVHWWGCGRDRDRDRDRDRSDNSVQTITPAMKDPDEQVVAAG